MFTSSSVVYTVIKILPNSTDDWVNSGIVQGYPMDSGDSGYFLVNDPVKDCPGFTPLRGRVVDVGNVSKSIDIFKNTSSDMSGSDPSIKGIGAIAKTDDFSFSVENLSNTFKPLKTIGRTIRVELHNSSTSTTIFIGKVFTCDPKRDVISFTCRGVFEQWDKKLGTLNEAALSSSKVKINPILYGELSDTVVPTLQVTDKIIVGNTEGCSIKYFDPESKESYTLYSPQFNKTESYIGYFGPVRTTLFEDLTPLQEEIKLYNPAKVAFTIPNAPAELVVGYEVYDDNGKYYKMLEIKDGYYVFTASDSLPPITGNLSSSQFSVPYTFRSELIDPNIIFNRANFVGEYDVGGPIDWPFFDKSEQCLIRMYVDGTGGYEDILLLYVSSTNYHIDTHLYLSTTYKAVRRYSKSSVMATFLVGQEIYTPTEEMVGELLLGIYLYPSGIDKATTSYFLINTEDVAQEVVSDSMLSIASGSYLDLISIQRNKTLGNTVVFELPSLPVDSALNQVVSYIDFRFPSLSLEGHVERMFVLGVFGVDDPGSSIQILKGGAQNVFWVQNFSSGGGGVLLQAAGCGLIHGINSMSQLVNYSFGRLWYNKTAHDTNNLQNPTGFLDLSLGISGKVNELSEIKDTRYSVVLGCGFQTGVKSFSIKDFGFFVTIRINPNKVPLYVSVTGKLDSESGLIEKPAEIVKDLFISEIGLDESDVEIPFTTEDRTTFYYLEEPKPVFSVINDFVSESGLILSEHQGKMYIDTSAPPSSTTGLRVLHDTEFTLDENRVFDWNQEYTAMSSLFTQFVAKYKINVSLPEDYSASISESDLLLTGPYLEEAYQYLDSDKRVSILFKYARNLPTVERAVLLLARYCSKPLRVISIEGTLSLCDLRLSQWVVTDSSYLPNSSDKIYLVIDIEIAPTEGKTQIKLLEMDL